VPKRTQGAVLALGRFNVVLELAHITLQTSLQACGRTIGTRQTQQTLHRARGWREPTRGAVSATGIARFVLIRH